MKKASTRVFDLIKSMSMGEKQYFSKKAKAAGKDAVYTLYKALNSMESFDEKELIRKLGNRDIVKNLSVEKSRLAEQLLASLREHRQKGQTDKDLFDLMQTSRVLTERGFYSWSQEFVDKAKKVVRSDELYWAIPPLLDSQRALIQKQQAPNVHEQIEINLQETEYYLNELQKLYMYKALYIRVLQLIRTDPDDLSVRTNMLVSSTLEHPLIKYDGMAVTFESKRLRYLVRANCFHLLKDFEQAFACRQLLLDLWETHPEKQGKDIQNYIKALANMAGIAVQLPQMKLDDCKGLLNKLRQIKKSQIKTFDDRAEFFQSKSFVEIRLLLALKDYKAVMDMADFVEDQLERFRTKINSARLIAFNDHIAVAALCQGDCVIARRWLQKIVQNRNSPARSDTQIKARLLLPIVSIMLDEFETAAKELKAAGSYIRKKHTGNKLLDCCLDFIRKLINCGSIDYEQKRVLRKFDSALDQLAPEAQSYSNYGYDTIREWIAIRLKPSRKA